MRVLIVDDHELFRSGLRMLLGEEGLDVSDADSGPAALRRIAVQPPDVVLMDINMPAMSGVVATREIQRIAPGLPVIMLTAVMEDDHVLDAVRAGACGYLLKDAELGDIVAGVRRAVAGESTIAPRVAGGLLAFVRAGEPKDGGESSAPAVALSDRERDVLRLLTDGAENADIARRLHISVSTVKNHVSSILEKLGAENRVQAAVYAIRRGLVADTARD